MNATKLLLALVPRRVKMKGYRSIGVSVAGIAVGALATSGIVVPQDVEAGIATIVSFVIMLGMRLITTGKVGEK